MFTVNKHWKNALHPVTYIVVSIQKWNITPSIAFKTAKLFYNGYCSIWKHVATDSVIPLTSLKCVFDIVHLNLWSRHSEYPFMLQPYKKTAGKTIREVKDQLTSTSVKVMSCKSIRGPIGTTAQTEPRRAKCSAPLCKNFLLQNLRERLQGRTELTCWKKVKKYSLRQYATGIISNSILTFFHNFFHLGSIPKHFTKLTDMYTSCRLA